KQGMSAVVTTLIIILLVIVALGIIWVVVKNFVESGREQVEWAEKCRAVEIQAVKLNETATEGTYEVTLYRTGAGDVIAGVKLVFANGTAYSDVTEFGIVMGQLETKTNTGIVAGITNANELQITPYFEDDLGAEKLCETRIEEF
ncbi:unnamed protein product, partial [marine sediment metagenome]